MNLNDKKIFKKFNQRKESMKMDKEDKKILEILNKDIQIPESYFNIIHDTFTQLPEKTKKKFFSKQYKIALATTCCSLILLTEIVFAKDIEAYFRNLFTNSSEAIDNAIENGYVQSIDNDFVYDHDIRIKVDKLISDSLNLDISFCYETQNKIKTLQSIELEEYTITNERGEIVFEYDTEKVSESLAISMLKPVAPTKVTDTTFQGSILYGLKQNINLSNELHFAIKSLRLEYSDKVPEILKGNWNFTITINEDIKQTDDLHYRMLGTNKYVKSCTGTLAATGMIIEIQLFSPLDYSWFQETDLTKYFGLKYGDTNLLLSYFTAKNSKTDTNWIIKYDNISKFYDNIEEIELCLPMSDSTLILTKEN